MKHLGLLALCVCLAGSLLAQPPLGRGERRGEFGQVRWSRKPAAAEARTSGPRAWRAGPKAEFGQRRGDIPTTRILERMTKLLALTPEQQAKVKDILEKAKSELGESVGSLRELGDKTRERLREVLTEEQRAKLDKLRGDARETAGRMAQNYGPQIREGLERLGQEARLRMALRSLNLTNEQRQQIDAIEKETREKIKAIQEEVRPKIEAAREEAKKKVENVLTPEQREQLREQLQKMPAVSPPAGHGPEAGPNAERRGLPKGRPAVRPPQSFNGPRGEDARLAFLPPRPPQPMGNLGDDVMPLTYQSPLPPPPMDFALAAEDERNGLLNHYIEQPEAPRFPPPPSDVLLEIFA